MSKNISVKVKVSVLTEALRKALKEREERFANQQKLEEDYKKAQQKWESEFAKAVTALVKNGKGKVKKATEAHYYRHHSDTNPTTTTVELVVEVPKSIIKDEPQRPTTYHEWEWKQDKEALENAIRVLEMCDSEVVSTSTYHSVVKYL